MGRDAGRGRPVWLAPSVAAWLPRSQSSGIALGRSRPASPSPPRFSARRVAPEAASAASAQGGLRLARQAVPPQHPVRGFFGDPRIGMTPKGMRSSFHFGIDISCPNGTAVYATLDGVVRLESFRPETVSVVGRDGHTEFQYWHIKPAVRNGQRVKAYVTVVGWAEPPWEHVHFSERRDGVYVNPLRAGALGPFSDTTTPWVKQLRRRGRRAAAVSMRTRRRRSRRRGLRRDARPRPRALGRQARHARAAPLAGDDGNRASRAALALGDRPPPHDPLERPVLDAVRALDAPEQEEPAGPLPVRPPVRLGQPRRDRRALRRSRSRRPI